MQNAFVLRASGKGPLGLMTVLRLSKISGKPTGMSPISCFSLQAAPLKKPRPAVNAPGGQEPILALRASSTNPGVGAHPPPPRPLQSHGPLPSPLSKLLPRPPAVQPGTLSLHSLFFVRESSTSGYCQETGERAEIKTLAPNFQASSS